MPFELLIHPSDSPDLISHDFLNFGDREKALGDRLSTGAWLVDTSNFKLLYKMNHDIIKKTEENHGLFV